MLLKRFKVPVKVILDYADCCTNKKVPVHKESSVKTSVSACYNLFSRLQRFKSLALLLLY